MAPTTVETIDTMLAAVQQESDDSEQRFKLRTARQLLHVLEAQHDVGREAVGEAALDDDTRDDLEELGYLE